MKTDSKVAVVASIIANVAIAITKIAVALATSSTAMLAEGVHSIINCFDGTLLLIGDSRAKQPPDASHPFGYGREVFFWSLIVAVLFFALGGGFSIYEGIRRTVAPRPLGDPKWSYIVLGIAALFDGTSFVIGLRTFRAHAGGRAIWRAVRESKNPALFS
ncbi:MAG TPA: cation transporter, partial [Gemmatimonadaceae bacterium]